MKKLYDYGEHQMPIPAGFSITKTGWHLTKGLKPATKKQQKKLIELGWGEDKQLSVNGANVIIKDIQR